MHLKSIVESLTNLTDLLESTAEGRCLLLQASSSIFTEKNRSSLADIIYGHDLSKDISKRLTLQRLRSFADEIVKTFPFENILNWIECSLSCQTKLVIKGKLIRRYNTWRSVAKLPPIESTLKDLLLYDSISFESDLEEDSKLEVSLAYLRNLIVPWSTVEDLWIQTRETRFQFVNNVDKNVYDYFNAFPCLKEPQGFALLEKDFEFLYPASKENLFAEWPKLYQFIKTVLNEKKIGFLEANNSPKERVMRALMQFSEIFSDVTTMKRVGGCSWRPSKAESQDAFLLVIKTVEDLQPILQLRSEKLLKFGLNLQPVAVVVGGVEKFFQCFIIMDTVIYECDNPVKAIDLTFKFFHSLQIPYPPECAHIWTFLQQAVYRIQTKRDNNFVGCSDLVSQYSRHPILQSYCDQTDVCKVETL